MSFSNFAYLNDRELELVEYYRRGTVAALYICHRPLIAALWERRVKACDRLLRILTDQTTLSLATMRRRIWALRKKCERLRRVHADKSFI